MRVRKATKDDAAQIIDCHIKSIQELNAPDYQAKQIAAWIDRPFKISSWEDAIARDEFFVLEKENKIFGYSQLAVMDLEYAAILNFYLLPEISKQGFGKLLFEEMRAKASSLKLKRIELLSTITAKMFYEKLGFHRFEGPDSIEVRGVNIPCIPLSLNVL